MRLFNWIGTLISGGFDRSRLDGEIERELRSHIQLRADDLQRGGLARAEAMRRARVEFGGVAKYKEESHAAIGGHFLESVAQDIRYSLRLLRKSPGFTVTAVLTLALAIGANAVVFSVMNAFLLRPLNVPNPKSLYMLWWVAQHDGQLSYPDYLDLRDRTRSFEALVAYTVTLVGFDSGGNPTRAWIEEASGNYFDALGIQPFLGHFFHASDEHGPNSAPYIVLTYSYWHAQFHDDRGVIGRVVEINKRPFTIIGVAPEGFHGTLVFFNPAFFVPIVNHPGFGGSDLTSRHDTWVFMSMGHLKPGVTEQQAIADLNSVGSYLAKTYPKDDRETTFELKSPSLYGDFLGPPMRAFLTGLMLLSGLILLAACANLGSLFAARAADRSREVALRLALGSSRKRILRGLFTEATLISFAGGGVGLAGSVALLRALSLWEPIPRWPLQLSVDPDAKVYGVAVLLAVLSGLLFGVVPVRQVLEMNPYEVVKVGSGAKRGGRVTLRDVLLVAQIAICAVLVTASLVAVRGLARSIHGDFGFQAENEMLVDTDLGMAGYRADQWPAMQKRMVEAIQAIPGVASVGLSDSIPMGDAVADSNVFAESATDLRPGNAVADSMQFSISPDYFHAEGTALISGRGFTEHDGKDSPRVAVVNREFARRLFGTAGNALGRYFKMPDGARIEVVGLAEDGKYRGLTEDQRPAMYFPILQSPSSSVFIEVRSNGDQLALGEAIRNKLRNLDEGLPLYIQTRFRQMDAQLFGPRMATASLGVLGGMGAVLSITGIFGMAAYSVSKRLRELGIRIALGAQRTEVLSAALGRPLRLLAFGSAAGLLLGLLATKVLAFIVYQASPRDPLVLAGVVLAMLLLGLVATWIPAQRALSVNPLILLREE